MLKVSPIVYQPFILVDKREELEQLPPVPERIVTIRTTSNTSNAQKPPEISSLVPSSMTNPQDSQTVSPPQPLSPPTSTSIKLKKDALYKPLLRSFRAFFRKLIDIIGLSKGCHHWSNERLRKQVLIFMSFLELPACFMD